MRPILVSTFAALLLAACGQQAPPATGTTSQAAGDTVAPPWFICDAIDAPVLYLFADAPDDGHVHVVKYDKTTGASEWTADADVGESEGAAGSIYTPLTQNGEEFINVRQLNAGNLETPSAAFTRVYSSVMDHGQNVECRWLPRTRLFAFTGRRTIVIREDQDGDLLYTTYDFAQQPPAQPVELAENARTTTFSLEVREGQEQTSATGTVFTFTAPDGHVYRVTAGSNGRGQVEVLQGGNVIQNEPLTAFQTGEGAAQ
ncbi:hypothetical protein [Terricaulis sp.]|uniref:hypothetical protein n=1 Tax=Terricaulis sp. TaxID=2768686 RepID=UPI003784F8C4